MQRIMTHNLKLFWHGEHTTRVEILRVDVVRHRDRELALNVVRCTIGQLVLNVEVVHLLFKEIALLDFDVSTLGRRDLTHQHDAVELGLLDGMIDNHRVLLKLRIQQLLGEGRPSQEF